MKSSLPTAEIIDRAYGWIASALMAEHLGLDKWPWSKKKKRALIAGSPPADEALYEQAVAQFALIRGYVAHTMGSMEETDPSRAIRRRLGGHSQRDVDWVAQPSLGPQLARRFAREFPQLGIDPDGLAQAVTARIEG